MELAIEGRAAAIPVSRLPAPENAWQQLQYAFWHAYSYAHPAVRDFLLRIGAVKHEGRQNYILGRVAPGKTLDGLLAHLERQGFGNHFIAWGDDGEVVSLRRLDGPRFQYHLRIFKDGEVRGHYERTPETHPILHLKRIGMEDRWMEFADFLDDWIVPAARN